MNADKQYYSFLGGLVSQKLDERVDMDKFGKWFKVADNMRFFSTGAMQNRTGFVKVANTKNNLPNDNIRLLSFVFNNREAFLLELGQGYMRVFKDGAPILDTNGSIKVWNTSITFPADEDLKYAQSGDIIFLTIPSKGIYEIKRKNTEGTDWEITGFDTTIYPLGDENKNKQQRLTMTTSQGSENAWRAIATDVFKTYNEDAHIYMNATYGVSGGTTYANSQKISFNKNDIINSLNALVPTSSKTTFVVDNNNCIIDQKVTEPVQPIQMSVTTLGSQQVTKISKIWKDKSNAPIPASKSPIPFSVNFGAAGTGNFAYLKESYELTTEDLNEIASRTSDNTGLSLMDEAISKINAKIQADATAAGVSYKYIVYFGKCKVSGGANLNYSLSPTSDNAVGTSLTCYCYKETNYGSISYGLFVATISYKYPVVNSSGSMYPFFTSSTTAQFDVTSDFDFFNNKQVGDVFSIRKRIDAQVKSSANAGNNTYDVGYCGPNWRLVTSGNWAGTLTLQYFAESDGEWKSFRTVSSSNQDQPTNDNSAGKIDGYDVVQFRIVTAVTGSGALHFDFNTDGNEVNVYFRIDKIESARKATCVAIKNSCFSGTYSTYLWTLAAFSSSAGWPESVGFYQNRLFFGKDYNLYSSKTNDFWDFYEPIAVNDDDPINMSLLSYKVNEIVNIVTLKSFFVFTAGGEFGIGSSGALTQKDKFLKQYSAHGSAKPLPIVAGNMIMFVDTSEHTVRAFQYSFETDTYEAQDISVLLDEIIKGEKIISTAYSSNEKECYFLTEKGEIFVLKFFPEQNILAWSKWKHAKYHIKNICIMPRGSEEDLYIAVNTENGMQIERMTNNFYADSVNVYNNDSEVEEINVPFPEGSEVVVNDTINKYKAIVRENGVIKLARPAKTVYVGLAYKSHAALLAPVTMLQDGSATTYNLRKTFKVHFKYSDSYGFKVGVLGSEHLLPNYQDVNQTIDNETVLTTGKKSVLMPSRYDMQGSVSFVQEQPYPMIIENIMLEIDYGNR